RTHLVFPRAPLEFLDLTRVVWQKLTVVQAALSEASTRGQIEAHALRQHLRRSNRLHKRSREIRGRAPFFVQVCWRKSGGVVEGVEQTPHARLSTAPQSSSQTRRCSGSHRRGRNTCR